MREHPLKLGFRICARVPEIVALILFFIVRAAFAQGPVNFDAELETIRAKHKLPALAALAMTGGEVRAAGAVGVRKLGAIERVTRNDKWHIGSNTKAMTATLAAMLVEQGKLRWDSKIGDVLPEMRESMDESWQTTTLEMLLTHRGGAPEQPPDNLWRNAFRRVGPPIEQRREFVSGILLRRTQAPPGTKYLYSNQGYSIAGAMLERVGGKPWEDLMGTMLFEPCNMTSAGFGAPATPGKIDQPWGHLGAEMTPVPPADPGSDNPPAIGPGGTVHCSLVDLARFAAMHSLGERTGTMFLRKEGFRRLHKAPEGQTYAFGWETVGGAALTHAGSNTMFFCVVWIFPAKDAVLVAATNCAGEKAATATDEAVSAMGEKIMKR